MLEDGFEMYIVKSDMGDGGWSIHAGSPLDSNEDGGPMIARGYAGRDEYGDYVWPDLNAFAQELETDLGETN